MNHRTSSSHILRHSATILLAIALLCFLHSIATATDIITWAGPIEILSDKFVKYGGPFGYIHSLDQGDCCCGGPATEDMYPDRIRVDENGNIIIGDMAQHMYNNKKIHLFNPEGKLIRSFTQSQSKDGCTSGGYYWPGNIQLRANRIFVETGFCLQAYDYSGKLLWSAGKERNNYLDLQMITNDGIILKRYLQDPLHARMGEEKKLEAGWAIYDFNGKLVSREKSYDLPLRRDGSDIVAQKIYKDAFSGSTWYSFKADKMNYLYVFKINDKPKNYKDINRYPAGNIEIFDSQTKKVFVIQLPANRYARNRSCGGDGYVAFAGKDVIEEYGANGSGTDVDWHGNVYVTLFMPKELKILKWVPVNLSKPLPKEVINKINQHGIRLLRNEIYARKGRKFQSDDLNSYFKGQPWYAPDNSYNDGRLSDIDKKNVELLLSLEKLK